MDRRTKSHLALGSLWLGAVALAGCGQTPPIENTASLAPTEPRRLQWSGPVQSLEPVATQQATQTAYPLMARGSSTAPPAPVVDLGVQVAPPSSSAAVPLNAGPYNANSGGGPDFGAPPAFGAAAGDVDGRLPPVDDIAPLELTGQPPAELPPQGGLRAAGPSVSPPQWIASAAPAMSPGMLAVNRRANQMVARGCSLAERGALYSARSEFVEALRVVAEALDVEQSTDTHIRALRAGLTAMREVSDFRPKRATAEQGITLEHAAAAHVTPVIRQAGIENLTPLTAQQRYMTFARQQFEIAAGKQPAASYALYGLGRVAIVATRTEAAAVLGDVGQAMALYQASVAADPRNFRAAHELGVLLADNGHWDAARDMFSHALTISPQPATWQNLAVAYDRLGQPALAEKARANVPKGYGTVPDVRLRWVDAKSFAGTASGPDGAMTPQQAIGVTPQGGTPQTGGTAAQPNGRSPARR